MRIDKFLKVSRLVKRRTVAKEMADQGRIEVNGRVVKSSYDVKLGDVIEVGYGTRVVKAKVINIRETTKKAEASELYELVD
ncbi:MAG: RNA-binding S4 domain-containing protein [Lactobacillus sp.]|nr:RNA-binding S4 domain-containing protein [Lactobacillus sp.]